MLISMHHILSGQYKVGVIEFSSSVWCYKGENPSFPFSLLRYGLMQGHRYFSLMLFARVSLLLLEATINTLTTATGQ